MTGFYATIIRAKRVGYLAGPFNSETDARAALPAARSLASEIDPWSDFDLFGTARVERENLPAGVLNARLGIAA